eukprot:scaffold533_cov369-Prasinococcus_capsulatus_cf.AAC.11
MGCTAAEVAKAAPPKYLRRARAAPTSAGVTRGEEHHCTVLQRAMPRALHCTGLDCVARHAVPRLENGERTRDATMAAAHTGERARRCHERLHKVADGVALPLDLVHSACLVHLSLLPRMCKVVSRQPTSRTKPRLRALCAGARIATRQWQPCQHSASLL